MCVLQNWLAMDGSSWIHVPQEGEEGNDEPTFEALSSSTYGIVWAPSSSGNAVEEDAVAAETEGADDGSIQDRPGVDHGDDGDEADVVMVSATEARQTSETDVAPGPLPAPRNRPWFDHMFQLLAGHFR